MLHISRVSQVHSGTEPDESCMYSTNNSLKVGQAHVFRACMQVTLSEILLVKIGPTI